MPERWCRHSNRGAMQFLFFSPYIILLLFLHFFSSTSRWYAGSSVPVATRERGYLDISYPGTYIRTGTLISLLFIV